MFEAESRVRHGQVMPGTWNSVCRNVGECGCEVAVADSVVLSPHESDGDVSG